MGMGVGGARILGVGGWGGRARRSGARQKQTRSGCYNSSSKSRWK